MALTPTQILANDKLTIRQKFNQLLEDFAEFTFAYGELEIDLSLAITGALDAIGAITQNGTQVSLDGHSHGDIYYTETEIDNGFYTKTAVNNLLLNYFKLDGSYPITGDIIQRDGTGDQSHSLKQYAEYTDSSNYSRSVFEVEDDVYGNPTLRIGTESLGSGTPMETVKVRDTHEIKEYIYNDDLADDASITLPTLLGAARGWVIAGDNEERTDFAVKSDGTVTLINNSANIVANSDTDSNICIGTSVANPVLIKNRLGGTKNIMLMMWYE